MTDFVKVPTSQLKKLEESRIEIYVLAEKYNIPINELLPVTYQIWRVAHTRKWKE